MPKRTKSSDPILQRAIDITRLKYGAKTDSILDAIKQAAQIRTDTIRQAKSGAKYATDSERYGQKNIRSAFGAIGTAAAQSGAFMDKLTPVPDGSPGSAVLAAIQSSRAAIPTNVATMQAQAIQDSESRAARARAGGEFAVNAANATFAGNVGKLRDQLAATQNEAGLSTQSTYQDLLDDYNKEQRQWAELEERKRHNAATEANDAAGGKSKRKMLTPGEQNTYRTNVSKALGDIAQLKGMGLTGKEIRELLSGGGAGPAGTYTDPETGKQKRVAGKKFSSYGTDVTRVAMDLYFNSPDPGKLPGTLTKTGRGIMRRAGVKAPKNWIRYTPPKGTLPGPFGA